MSTPAEGRGDLGPGGRIALRCIVAGLRLLQRLPDRPLYRLAYVAGTGLYLISPGRRAMARANLRRVCVDLVEKGRASPRVAAAASDPRRLEAMVRAAFGHWLVSYVEGALAPRYTREDLIALIEPMTPAASEEALRPAGAGELGPIHMSMHFGSIDISALYGARVAPHPLTGPMEEVANPIARAYFGHVRRELGATIVPLKGAAKSLAAAVERGEAVGVVADRLIVGSGHEVELFGHPMRMSIGPAVLSIQTGATIYLHAIERAELGHWKGHTVVIRADDRSNRKQALRSILKQEVDAFEHLVARAPEQWSTIMFPIWDDIDGTPA